MPVYPQQDNINLGSGATVEDRQEAYDNQGATVVDLTTNATLDIGASLTWLVRNANDTPILGLEEDFAGNGTEVYIGGKINSGTRGVDIFSVSVAQVFEINAEANTAGNQTAQIIGSNLGAGDFNLEIQADLIDLNGAINMGGGISGAVGFFDTTPIAKETVSGSTGANAALQALLTALANYGLITDSTT